MGNVRINLDDVESLGEKFLDIEVNLKCQLGV